MPQMFPIPLSIFFCICMIFLSFSPSFFFLKKKNVSHDFKNNNLLQMEMMKLKW